MTSISTDEWLKALEDAMRKQTGNEGFTTQELCLMFKVSNARMKNYLREMIRLGKVVPAASFRQAIDGILRHVPIYILKKEK